MAHQNAYAQQLQPIDLKGTRHLAPETLVDSSQHSLYMSLLGGAAWLTLTRVDLSIFIQALQRRAHAPRAIDVKRLNTVVRYAKRRPLGLFYAPLHKDGFMITTISDAAFKAQPGDSSAGTARLLHTTQQRKRHATCKYDWTMSPT